MKNNKNNIDIDNILKNTNNDLKSILLFELSSKLKEKGFNVDIDTLKDMNVKQIKEAKRETIETVSLLDKLNKGKNYIQGIIDSNIIILNYNYNKENYKAFKTRLLNKDKIDFFDETSNIKLNSPEKKIEYVKLALNYKMNLSEIQKDNLKAIAKNIETKELHHLIKDLKEERTLQRKESIIRTGLEKINIIVKNDKDNGNKHLYNQDYYDLIENPRISNQKIGIIKYAYFHNGIDLKEFSNDLQDDLFKSDAEQLKNYVDAFTKYKDDFLSKNEYEFAKKVINDYDINQKEIGECILPAIEKSKLSEKQIQECIYAGKNRDYGDTTKIVKLADTAKEFGFADNEISRIIENSAKEKTIKIEQEIDLINEYGYSKITNPEAMKKLEIKEIEILLKDTEKGKVLNNSTIEI